MTAEDIARINDIEIISVIVPEWNNATIYLKTLDSDERNKLEWSSIDVRLEGTRPVASIKKDNAKIHLLIKCICDQNGVRLFNDSLEHREILAKKNGSVIDMLNNKARELNKMQSESVEELEKNLNIDQL